MNMLPKRPTLLEHMGDIANHRCWSAATACPCIWRLVLDVLRDDLQLHQPVGDPRLWLAGASRITTAGGILLSKRF